MRKRTSKIWTISKQELESLANGSNSIREMLVKLGYRPNSGKMFYALKKRLESEQIFIVTDQAHKHRIPLDNILVQGSLYSRHNLKRRLMEKKLLDYVCAKCGNLGEWNGQNLSLQLDHINGDPIDNRLFNLRFLCPNCHSQTKTFAGKNSGSVNG